MDYKDTLNLPKTDFSMKANLSEQEPKRIDKWQKCDLYGKILLRRDKSKKYVLHDGPPYANGNIHIGTAFNKILKDFIVKAKSGQGFYSPYIPGWDCHGLPIEHKVDKELGEKKASVSKSEIRKLCRKYADRWIGIQKESFKRLGVIGDWDNPYITMNYKYESITLREFYKVYKTGSVYRGSKPVYWCSTCVTALAEAEVEYADRSSYSLFVKFPLTETSLGKLGFDSPISAVIWTTTAWTLPANLGICVHPSEDYAVMRVDEAVSENLKPGELLLAAKPLVTENKDQTPLREKLGVIKWSEIRVLPGKELNRLTAKHPFYDRESLLMLGEHVLMTDGTGLVHTAPAHGQEDYIVGNQYGLEILNPVDDYGVFKADLPIFGGQNIADANSRIVKHIKDNGTLIMESQIIHSYPHCWRCRNPVIFRATPQWFISMDHNGLRNKALRAIENDVRWIPSWGADRIHSMIETRPDWCISRQRSWGVPIALFICRSCEKVILNDEIEEKVVRSFEQVGADAWFEYGAEYYLGKDSVCPHCGGTDIRKEADILDVWFDSGTSHAAVCEVRPEINGRADMYLEGTDQHRGWFHSSLLESIVTRARAPFREVLTHGFVVDGDLRKMSKTFGNVISPDELISAHGAEIIRLWVACEDYTEDIRISDELIKRLVESYRKIRNTIRYLLGSISDFNPDADSISFDNMMDLDRYILLRWQDTMSRIYAGYENYQFYVFYHTFINFCINDLSAFYLDIIKDRAYSFRADSYERRSAQTVMFIMAREMATVMAVVLSFTADEAWEYLPVWENKAAFVFEETFPSIDRYKDDAIMVEFDKLFKLRKAVNKALEFSRAEKVIGHSLDAKVTIGAKDDPPKINEGLTRLLIVSEIEFEGFDRMGGTLNEDGDIWVKVEPSGAPKCARCWTRDRTVGESPKYTDICGRCAKALG